MPKWFAVGFLDAFYRPDRLMVWGCLGLFLAAPIARADSLELEAAGARYGSPANQSAESFRQGEAFADWRMPWCWRLGPDWQVRTRLDASAGWVGDSAADAFIGTLGPGFIWGWRQLPLHLDLAISPTVLSHVHFGRKDFGMPFQFTGHAGLDLDMLSRVRLSYRFTHMSNAGLNGHNPGLNLHFVGVSYVF